MTDTTAVLGQRPKTLRKDVELACEAATIIALGLSVELNVYDHLKLGHIVPLLAWTVGIAVPLLVAILSHAAAHVNFHRAVKVWIFLIVSILMYVSASAGTKLLTPGMGHGPALGTAYGMDLAALTTLGILMYSAVQKSALAKWEAAREELRLQAEAKARELADQAEYERLTQQFSRAGNRRGNAGGNDRGNDRGNAIAGPEGNAAARWPGNAGPFPALDPAAAAGVVAGTAETVQGATPTGPLASVTDLPRRPSMSDEQMETLATQLAAKLDVVGQELTVRNFMDLYGGRPARVGPIVKKVKQARAAGAAQAAAGE